MIYRTECAPRLDATERPRLAEFIRDNLEPIVSEWLSFAGTRTPASDNMNEAALRDHIVEILAFISRDLESPQTQTEQQKKSHSEGLKEGGTARSAAEIHAALRLSDGFDIDQLVSEYRALRASVVRLWRVQQGVLDQRDVDELTRFNEAIDQATAESVAHYTRKLAYTRNLFLGILGHDLRNPIGAASMSAEMMLINGGLIPGCDDINTLPRRGCRLTRYVPDLPLAIARRLRRRRQFRRSCPKPTHRVCFVSDNPKPFPSD